MKRTKSVGTIKKHNTSKIIPQLVEFRHRDCVVLNVLSSSPLLTINFLSVVHIFQLLLYQITPLFCLLDLRRPMDEGYGGGIR